MLSCSIGVAAFGFCSSCNSSNDSAKEVLAKARMAMSEDKFDDARRMIDSLRTTFPKEFDVRLEAMAFADSVELIEAKKGVVAADSMLTFKEFELADMKSLFVLEKNEKYQSQGFYVLPKYAGNKTKFSFFPEVEESGKMLLVAIDSNRKYLFTEVPVAADGYESILKQFAVSEETKKDVAECYKLAVAFKEYSDAKELKEKLDLKIRFFEKKLKEREL